LVMCSYLALASLTLVLSRAFTDREWSLNGLNNALLKEYQQVKSSLSSRLWEIQLLFAVGTLQVCLLIKYQLKTVFLLQRLKDGPYVLILSSKPTNGSRTWRKTTIFFC